LLAAASEKLTNLLIGFESNLTFRVINYNGTFLSLLEDAYETETNGESYYYAQATDGKWIALPYPIRQRATT
jgi:hypothetical protein